MSSPRRSQPQKLRSQPQELGSLIPVVLQELGLDGASEYAQLLAAWDECFGPELAPHCRPDGLARGVMRARVRDSAWMQRVQLEKPEILARVRATLGEAAPTELRFRVGSVDEEEAGG
jgi:predicted nucleic acid-binding Zn ribbon protein